MLQRADQSPFETPWLSWIGRWQYQLSAGQLSQYSSVPHTKLIGARFTMMPTDFTELGASRVMQWGGEGRPQSRVRSGKALAAVIMMIPAEVMIRATSSPVSISN